MNTSITRMIIIVNMRFISLLYGIGEWIGMKVKNLIDKMCDKGRLLFEDAEGRIYHHMIFNNEEILASVVQDGIKHKLSQFEENLQHVNYLYYHINRIMIVDDYKDVYRNIGNKEYFQGLEIVWER